MDINGYRGDTMKKENGSLTIEASISLVFFVLVMFTFMAIARFTTMQNRVKHSLNQTAITFSARNQYLNNFGSCVEQLTGATVAEYKDFLDLFSEKLGSGTLESKVPYTNEHMSNDTLKYEVEKIFVAEFFGLDYEDAENSSLITSALKNDNITYTVPSLDGKSDSEKEAIFLEVLEKEGIKELSFEGGYDGGKFIGEPSDEDKAAYHLGGNKQLYVKLTYKLDVPFSFAEALGSAAEPEFSDSIKMTILE